MTDIKPGDIVLDRDTCNMWLVDSIEHGVLRLTNEHIKDNGLALLMGRAAEEMEDALALMPANKVDRYIGKGEPLYSEMLCDVMGWTREAAAVNWWEYDPHDDQDW